VCVIPPPFHGSETGTAQIIGATVGSAAIAGIAVGAVVAVAATSAGGAAAYSQLSAASTTTSVASNPLYVQSGKAGTNPLHKV